MTRLPDPVGPADGAAPPDSAASHVGSAPAAARAFAHHSEAEFARILDFYEVSWQYEPHVYPIMWSLDGGVQESFAPDFYLPDLDLYVELTTLRQRLVRKKNRKLRRLRELYPDIRIKLFYERDFRALMLKYGKLAIADELSGTVGQVGASRAADDRGPAAVALTPTGSPAGPGPGAAPRPDRVDAPARASSPGTPTAASGPTAAPSIRRTRRTDEATAR